MTPRKRRLARGWPAWRQCRGREAGEALRRPRHSLISVDIQPNPPQRLQSRGGTS